MATTEVAPPESDAGQQPDAGVDAFPLASFKCYPPRLPHVLVPLHPRAAAYAALMLYAPCRPRASLLHRLAALAVRGTGVGWLPGRARAWSPPLEPGVWKELSARLQREVGRFDTLAIRVRVQANWPGVSVLLLRGGRPLAFVRTRAGASVDLQREFDTLERLARFRTRAFAAPVPLALGAVAGWSYLAMTALPAGPHFVPREPPLLAVVEEIQAALGAMPRAAVVPCHWKPMHGDLTPWNLRRGADHRLYLYDWEDSGWGPADADLARYQAAARAIGARAHPHPVSREAIAFCKGRLNKRAPEHHRERQLAVGMLRALEELLTL